MLMVDQAAGSYRALMILSKKHPSLGREPQRHIHESGCRSPSPQHTQESRSMALKAESGFQPPPTHISLKECPCSGIFNHPCRSALAYNYLNKLEIYYLSIRVINADSVKRSCLILPKLIPTLFYVPLQPLYFAQF